jgi:hypothetical protein
MHIYCGDAGLIVEIMTVETMQQNSGCFKNNRNYLDLTGGAPK